MQGFCNAMCLIWICFVAPLGMHCKNRDEAFLFVFIVVMSFSFPFIGYGVTWGLPNEEAVKGRSPKLQQPTQSV